MISNGEVLKFNKKCFVRFYDVKCESCSEDCGTHLGYVLNNEYEANSDLLNLIGRLQSKNSELQLGIRSLILNPNDTLEFRWKVMNNISGANGKEYIGKVELGIEVISID